MKRRARFVVGSILTAIIIGGGILWWAHRQLVSDWLVVQVAGEPEQSVASLASRAAMSKQGERIFFASQPIINDAAQFNQHCGRREMAAAVLGCYDGKQIFIYNVTNKELDGIQEVTAAHEMLHAAWDRLSVRTRDKLGLLLEDAYERVKTPELAERMAYYARQQPGGHINELHSIIGTEFSDGLGDELEEHYRRYFDDRQKVVALYLSYHDVMTEIDEKVKELGNEVQRIANSINKVIAVYNRDVERLSRETDFHNNQLTMIDRTDSAQVDDYNTRQARLQTERRRLGGEKKGLDSKRARYDKKLREYNAIVIRSEKLTSSIDSYQ